MKIEIRRASVAPETAGAGLAFTGIAVPYNEYTEIREHGVTFRERFLPGSMEVPASAILKLGHEPGGCPWREPARALSSSTLTIRGGLRSAQVFPRAGGTLLKRSSEGISRVRSPSVSTTLKTKNEL